MISWCKILLCSNKEQSFYSKWPPPVIIASESDILVSSLTVAAILFKMVWSSVDICLQILPCSDHNNLPSRPSYSDSYFLKSASGSWNGCTSFVFQSWLKLSLSHLKIQLPLNIVISGVIEAEEWLIPLWTLSQYFTVDDWYWYWCWRGQVTVYGRQRYNFIISWCYDSKKMARHSRF